MTDEETPHSITRREFVAGAAAAVAGAALLGACSSEQSGSAAKTTTTVGLPEPSKAPFDTVVNLMMENRSFDHVLGWFPGAQGKQAGLTFVDKAGNPQKTWPLAPDWQAWTMADPAHEWEPVAQQWNNGKCDGFLKTQAVGDHFPIGYYTEADLPVLAKLARSYTTYDHYFCSLLAATWPNKFYQHCAATDVDHTGLYPGFGSIAPDEMPPPNAPRPSKLQLAIWDRVREAGLTGGYYYNSEPMTGLFESRRYDDITYHYSKFKEDAAAGKLPNVTFLDPDWGTVAELMGTSNDMHPHGSVKVADAYIGEVYNILRNSPQWERMVFVLNFDEHGGFYDTVPPPQVRDNNVNPNPGPHPDYSRLGFRVPCVVMGPFAPKKLATEGPYEHASTLRMIEWRWGLEPMHDRDRYARNLAEQLDFSTRREAVDITVPTPPPTIKRPANAPG